MEKRKGRRGVGNVLKPVLVLAAIWGANHTSGMKRSIAIKVEASIALLPNRWQRAPAQTTTFAMEGSTVEPTHGPQNLSDSEDHILLPTAYPFLLPTAYLFLSSISCLVLIPAAPIPDMGRRPWATPEQLLYLHSFVPLLTHAKGTTGLNTLHSQVYEGFLKQWDPAPVPVPKTPTSPEDLEAAAKQRLLTVSFHVRFLLLECSWSASASPIGTEKHGRTHLRRRGLSHTLSHTRNQPLVSSTYRAR
jgi:hypothetical protein